jgi:DNA modification methylase
MTVTMLIGDVRAQLANLPADHFDCVVTSPPYWGLRDYGVAGQIGMEPTLAEHLAVMVGVFAAVRRVLKPSGTLWLNYGDCYATTPNGRSVADAKAAGGDDRTFRDKPFSTVQGTLKPKDLCMVPNRLAIALQDAGWWVRSEIIWGKPNAMPDSSGRFRPATAHEKIFLLAKSDRPAFWVARDTGEISASPDLAERCIMITTGELGARWIALGHYWDAAGVRQEPSSAGSRKMPDGWATGPGSHGDFVKDGRTKGARIDKQRGNGRRHDGFNDRWDQMTRDEQTLSGRLLRNYEPAPLPVWDMATAAFSDAHFATFPPDLVERCLKAGCPRGGAVLDPFGGAGTTGLVADAMGHDCTLIELNPDYAALAMNRIAAQRSGPITRAALTPQRGDLGPLFDAAESADPSEIDDPTEIMDTEQYLEHLLAKG